MKPANNAPVYAAMYSDLAELCREHGYALAIHGSLRRDFDVIAIPWVETPSPPQSVVDDLTRRFAITNLSEEGPSIKLHGRLCWTLSILFGETALDFSVMPPKEGIE